MNAHDYVNNLRWQGNLGALLACTSRLIPAGSAVVSMAGEGQSPERVAKRYKVDDHSGKPWLEITVQLHRPASGCGAVQDAFTVPFDADLAAVARDVHAVAMLLIRKAVYGEATVNGPRARMKDWDISAMADEPDSSSTSPATWLDPS
jgi:hypothetical protein